MRVLGWLLIALAGLVLALDASRWTEGVYALSALEALWTRLSAGSLAWSQARVEQHLSPEAWPRWVQPLLRLPALLVFALPGLALLALADLGARYGMGGVLEGTSAARRRHRRKGGLRE